MCTTCPDIRKSSFTVSKIKEFTSHDESGEMKSRT